MISIGMIFIQDTISGLGVQKGPSWLNQVGSVYLVRIPLGHSPGPGIKEKVE
jgi:hypothetical protein